MNHLCKYAVGIALSLAISVANAAISSPSMELRPDSPVVAPGGSISFDLFVDFGTNTTPGGALDIAFDPGVFSLGSPDWFVFNPAFHHEESFDRKITYDDMPGLVSIGFFNLFSPPFTGPNTIGKLLLNVSPSAAQGDASVALRESVIWGGFVGLTVPFPPSPSITNVNISAVPLPPTAWLFASGLVMLGLLRLQRRLGSAEASGPDGTFA